VNTNLLPQQLVPKKVKEYEPLKNSRSSNVSKVKTNGSAGANSRKQASLENDDLI